MKIAISNIAWRNEEEDEIATVLQSLGVDLVEVAPTKIWADPTKVSDNEIRKYKEFWNRRDIDIIAVQSMLFGREHLTIFEDETIRQETKKFLQDSINVAAKLGAKRMVFGSPKNRQKGEITNEKALQIAEDFFRDIADTAKKNNLIFCIEPNPEAYNCDFITNANDGAELVERVSHPNFKLHLDIAGMTLAGDDLKSCVMEHSSILAHTHISAPMLGDVPSNEIDYDSFFNTLRSVKFSGVCSVEMRPSNGPNISRVKAAIEYVKTFT